jgi:hypothetical protein
MVKSTFVRVCLAATIVIGLATSLSASHSWGGYHWARTANPFTLKVGDNVSAAWDSYLNTALSDWSGSNVLNLTKVAGTAKPRTCKPTAGRIEVCDAAYGFNGWLGIAQIWITGGEHITQAVTKLNNSYFNTATYDTPDWRQMVICQEVGHDFGLDHQDENFNNENLGSCMDYTSDPSTNTHPNWHDYEELETIYQHLDTTTTVGASTLPSAMPPAMGLIDFDNPGQWGRLVSRSRNGRSETYELDFGRGNKVVTHVFWADPNNDAR